jgi:hypothetical protein
LATALALSVVHPGLPYPVFSWWPLCPSL